MNKYQLRGYLQAGQPLTALFDFVEGQDCMIYKGGFEKSNEIIYIPNLGLNEIETDRALTEEEIDQVINNCYICNFIV